MAENLITNANDVELVIESIDENNRRGTPAGMGRLVVDEFTITREEDDTLESGVGHRLPVGLSNGDITHSFSFTMMGDDVSLFEAVATKNGRSKLFSFTARKREDGEIVWEYALDICKATSEEVTASSGDPMEYAVDGIAVRVDKKGTRADGESAWANE
jgi:hypothetical protein